MEQAPLSDMRTPTPAATSSDTPHSRTSNGPLLALVIIIVIGIIIWLVAMGPQGETVTYDEEGNPITHVESGKVVGAFPEQFLVEEGVTIEESYTIDYAGSETLLSTARYLSAMSLADNINAFGAIFVTDGWYVTFEPDYEATGPTNFYATKGQEQVNVTFVPQAAGIEVIISHLRQQ